MQAGPAKVFRPGHRAAAESVERRLNNTAGVLLPGVGFTRLPAIRNLPAVLEWHLFVEGNNLRGKSFKS
jgi:hypothetical protein